MHELKPDADQPPIAKPIGSTVSSKASFPLGPASPTRTFAWNTFQWVALTLSQALFIFGFALPGMWLFHGPARLFLAVGILVGLVLVVWLRHSSWVYWLSSAPAAALAGHLLVAAFVFQMNFFAVILLGNLLFAIGIALTIAVVTAGVMTLTDPISGEARRAANVIGGSFLGFLLFILSIGVRPTRGKLVSAVASGNRPVAQCLLWAGVSPDSHSMRQPWSGRPQPDKSVLAMAAWRGDDAMVRLLLNNGADPNLSIRDDGYGPLYDAACSGKISTVRLLLDAGADCRGRDGAIALSVAATKESREVIDQLLAAGVPIDAQLWERTALESAAASGNVEIARHLLDCGANRSIEDGKALCAAANGGHLAMIELLLDAGTSIEEHGDAALQKAIHQLRSKAVALLLGSGARPRERGALSTARWSRDKNPFDPEHARAHPSQHDESFRSRALAAQQILNMIEAAWNASQRTNQ